MSLTEENPLHDSPILHQDIFRIILSFLPIHDLNQIHLSMLSSEKFKSLGMIACQDEFWRNHYDLKIKYLKTITVQTIYVDHSYQKIYPNYVQKYELFTNNFKFHLIEMKHEIDQQAQHRLDQFQKQLQNVSDSKNNFKQMTETRKIEQGISVIAKVSCRPHSFYSKKQLQKMCQKLPINQLLKDRLEKDLRFKIMLIGSKGVGKTCLEMAITSNVYRPEYIPTVSEIFQLLYVGNYPIESGVTSYLSIWDSAGGDEYDILRPLSYPDSDLFCLCFNIADLTSIEKLFSKWIIEVRRFSSTIPIILIGCKTDVRHHSEECEKAKQQHLFQPISFESGEALARLLGCVTYLETSAVTGEGTSEFIALCSQVLYVHYYQDELKKKNICKTQ